MTETDSNKFWRQGIKQKRRDRDFGIKQKQQKI